MTAPPLGIVVLGPPRSGTSATTRLLNLSGAHLCIGTDLLGGGPNNPTGHWESKTVLAINNRLHESSGTRWWCPLPAGASVNSDSVVDAGADFFAVHPVSPWVCKDPRFCFTLPFWRRTLKELLTVVVLRRPDEVVASMRRTWPISIEHATALWTRYTYAALSVSGSGCIVRFPEVLANPHVLTSALVRRGAELASVDEPAARMFVRTPRGAMDEHVLPAYAWDVWQHADVTPTGAACALLPPEPPAVEELLGDLREDLRAGRPLDMRPSFAAARAEH